MYASKFTKGKIYKNKNKQTKSMFIWKYINKKMKMTDLLKIHISSSARKELLGTSLH